MAKAKTTQKYEGYVSTNGDTLFYPASHFVNFTFPPGVWTAKFIVTAKTWEEALKRWHEHMGWSYSG